MDLNQQPHQDKPRAEGEGDAPRPKHDPGLRRLFSHRRMVADLLRLLPEDLAGRLDLGTLRRLPAEHVGDALRSRRSDMPWCIDLKHPGTCLLLLEFQSTVDPRMAERMQEYAAMLLGDLAREGKVRGPGGALPPLLPLLVYNGRRPWTAPVNLRSATEGLPTGLAEIQPKFQYVLLEVRRFDADDLALGLQGSASGVNFALAQFALENASAKDLPAAMAAVARLLKAEGELDLAESFGMWVEGVLERRLGIQLPSLTRMMEEPPMLEETLDEWAEEKFRLGQVDGVARGRAEGIERERALLRHLAQRRFGADVAEALSELIEGVDDAGRLTEVGDWVVDSATGSELLNRAGRA